MFALSTRSTARAALVAAILFAPRVSHAQIQTGNLATLVGMVKDSAGGPIGNVEVWIRGTDYFAHTNDAGGFRLPGLTPGTAKISLRRLGYEQAMVELDLRAGRTDSLVISLTTLAASLPGMSVEAEDRLHRALAGFFDRRSKGFGKFYTREDIDARHPQDFTDIVRTSPGVTIATISGRRQVRFARSTNSPRGDCPPQYWVDGMRIENGSADEFPPSDIEAIELYAGPATIPPQFAPRMVQVIKTCGAIVIWTKVPGT